MATLFEGNAPEDILAAYNSGLPGWHFGPGQQREWDAYWEDAPAYAAPPASGAEKVGRALLWLSREKYDPGAMSQEKQTTGDCVSHGSRTARDITRSVEIHIKGEPEEYFKRGATEPTYGCRSNRGQGMSPGEAAKFEREFGFLFRENYPGVVDLSKYNADIGAGWGAGRMPQEVRDLIKQKGYKVGAETRPKSLDEVYNLLASGYAGHSGQSWGTGGKTGADGINRKSAGWNHDMAVAGYDRTLEIWKEPVIFVPNSWGAWNSRNPLWTPDAEKILGPWIPGMIVVPEDEFDKYFIRSGSIHFYSEVAGFPVRDLPDYGFGYV